MIETTASPFPAIRLRPWLGIAATAAAILATWMGLLWAPTDAVQGDVYRVIFVHVPAAWLSYLAFVVVFLASVGWLWTRRPWFDALAVASAEIGVLFTGVFIVAGSIWAKPTWGVWWTWDPRLTSYLILWLIYIAYLMLRASARDDPRVARFSAVFGIVGAIDVPIVIMSARLWRSISPVLFQETAQGFTFGLTPEMVQTLMVCIVAFILLFFWLLAQRVRLEALRDDVLAIRRARAAREYTPVTLSTGSRSASGEAAARGARPARTA